MQFTDYVKNMLLALGCSDVEIRLLPDFSKSNISKSNIVNSEYSQIIARRGGLMFDMRVNNNGGVSDAKRVANYIILEFYKHKLNLSINQHVANNPFEV